MQLFKQFALANLQLKPQQLLGAFNGAAQQFANGEEYRGVVVNDAAAWGDAYFAVGKGVERVNGLVA